jgi:hypothetical protein
MCRPPKVIIWATNERKMPNSLKNKRPPYAPIERRFEWREHRLRDDPMAGGQTTPRTETASDARVARLGRLPKHHEKHDVRKARQAEKGSR